MMEGPGADSEEKHEPASDIDIAVVDSLKVLDPKWPIREADIRPLGPASKIAYARVESIGGGIGNAATRVHHAGRRRGCGLAACNESTKTTPPYRIHGMIVP
jgi:hypothetical protein